MDSGSLSRTYLVHLAHSVFSEEHHSGVGLKYWNGLICGADDKDDTTRKAVYDSILKKEIAFHRQQVNLFMTLLVM